MNTHTAAIPAGYAVVDPQPTQGDPAEWRGDRDSMRSRFAALHLNRWEIILWVLSVALIIVSIQANVYATQHLYMGSGGYSTECDSEGNCTSTTPASFVYLQSASTLSPAGFAAGLLGVIVALAVRALGSAARQRAALIPSTPPIPDAGTTGLAHRRSLPEPAGVPAESVAERTPVAHRGSVDPFTRPRSGGAAESDLSLFMRPGNRDSADD